MPEKFDHLPATLKQAAKRGWDRLDVVFVTGDANVDHPSFPANLLGRILEARDFRVGIIARPDVSDPESIAALGAPLLFFGVTAGALDSMVGNYTALKKRRSDDPYAPGGKAGGRPDRALTVYCNMIRQRFGKTATVVAGGLEAGLRKFAHYDFWSDSVRRPILMDCGADVAIHGLGERAIIDLADRMKLILEGDEKIAEARKGGLPVDPAMIVEKLTDLPGLVYRQPKSRPAPESGIELPSFESVKADPQRQADAFRLSQKHRSELLYQDCSGMRVIVNPPGSAMTGDELDEVFGLPFTREVHPIHKGLNVPALEQVRFSVTTHRGCFGGCGFCAIGAHQGKTVVSRSQGSILREVESIAEHKEFRGTINDIGGPSANMYGAHCKKPDGCDRPSCLWPSPCKHLMLDQEGYAALLAKVSRVKGVRHAFVTTGLRADMAVQSEVLMRQLARCHTSGLMKVAPEHVSETVLAKMRKPKIGTFMKFLEMFRKYSAEAGKQQYVIPYLMAAHPGSDLKEMMEVHSFLIRHKLRVEQCQIFTPTPGTAATVMYSTGIDPDSGEKVFVERRPEGKQMQKALILHHLPESKSRIQKAQELFGGQPSLQKPATRISKKKRRKPGRR